VPVNHIEGHICSAFIEHPAVEYPLLAVVVSGGHTSLIFSPEPEVYQSIGRARDDAAGEALDKLSKFLGLGYPGGPIIDRLAQRGDVRAFAFSIPKISDGSLDFSFSGFKTAALRHIEAAGIRPRRQTGGKIPQRVLDLVASYQRAIVEALLVQSRRAAERLRPRSPVRRRAGPLRRRRRRRRRARTSAASILSCSNWPTVRRSSFLSCVPSSRTCANGNPGRGSGSSRISSTRPPKSRPSRR